MFGPDSNKRLLGRQLGRVEHQYLRTQQKDGHTIRNELVQHIVREIFLNELRAKFSCAAFVGSNYESTAVPGTSDYDIQLSLKLPASLKIERDSNSAWAKVNGGPEELLDNRGYLSTSKARKSLQEMLGMVLQRDAWSYRGELIKMTPRMNSLATKICVCWREVQFNMDITVFVQSTDLYRSWWQGFSYNLVAVRYDSQDYQRDDQWRLSYARSEVSKLTCYNERKLTLLRIMKVIKQHQPQLCYFSSYFYKNLLFKLDEENPAASWSKDSDLSERFKDLIQLMHKTLRNGELPVYFNKEVNILQKESDVRMEEFANYFKRIIDRDAYIDLVVVVPVTDTDVAESVLLRYEYEPWECNIL